MSPSSDRPDIDESIANLAGVGRRPLLKALGAGAALAVGGGAVAAPGDDSEDRGGADDDAEQIDPVFGYPTTDAAEIPADLEPDHEVELAVAPPSGPGQPPFLYFDPTGLRVDSGDVVQFTSLTPDHTVTAYHPGIGFDEGRVPEESEPFSSPVLGPGAAWLYRFEHEGVYDVYCGPHHILGMVMRIVVGDLAEEDVPEYAQSVEGLPSSEDFEMGLNQLSERNEDCEWPFLMPAEVLGADVLAPTNVAESDEVPFAEVAEDLGYEFAPPETPPGHGPDGENATAEADETNGQGDTDGETDDY